MKSLCMKDDHDDRFKSINQAVGCCRQIHFKTLIMKVISKNCSFIKRNYSLRIKERMVRMQFRDFNGTLVQGKVQLVFFLLVLIFFKSIYSESFKAMKWFKENKTKKMVIEKCGVRTYETMCNNAHFIWIQKSIWLHCAHLTCLKMSQAFKRLSH